LQASGRGHIPLTAIDSSEWVRPTKPPPHAVLVNQAGAALGLRLRHWQEAVEEYCHLELAGVS
jgi:dTDP-4-dehydrorhamnose reductase